MSNLEVAILGSAKSIQPQPNQLTMPAPYNASVVRRSSYTRRDDDDDDVVMAHRWRTKIGMREGDGG